MINIVLAVLLAFGIYVALRESYLYHHARHNYDSILIGMAHRLSDVEPEEDNRQQALEFYRFLREQNLEESENSMIKW